MNIFETSRLVIRHIDDSHLVALKSVLSDPEIMRYSIVGVLSDKQIEQFIVKCEQQYQEFCFGQWAIHLKQNMSFVGVCGLNLHEVENSEMLHVNYRLNHKSQGNGFAVETVKGLAEYCKKHLNLQRISALIDPHNLASLKVAEKSGFRFSKSSSIEGFDVDIYRLTFEK